MNYREFFEKLYDILMEVCHAVPSYRDNFLYSFVEAEHAPYEWTFDHGCGGKLRWLGSGQVSVDYYPDFAKQYEAEEKEANRRIQALMASMGLKRVERGAR
jgi:hypothetical protein